MPLSIDSKASKTRQTRLLLLLLPLQLHLQLHQQLNLPLRPSNRFLFEPMKLVMLTPILTSHTKEIWLQLGRIFGSEMCFSL
jgi:hypothetical protein